MKIQIEKEIEVYTGRNFFGLNSLINHALKSNNTNDFYTAYKKDKNISDKDFFVYFGGSHIAVHEILPTGETSKRLLFIS